MQRITDVPRLPERPSDGHKGTFGKVLIVGGSRGFSGAPALSAKAALRSGAGLVRVAAPASIQPIVAALDPCYTTVELPEDRQGQISESAIPQILKQADENDVIAFGPGVGTGRGAEHVLLTLLAINDLPLVIDADGLNVLAALKGPGNWLRHKRASVILTPHPGEMKRLWGGLFRESLPSDRIEQAVRLAQHADCIVVLKGAGTVVTDGRCVYVNTTGNPGMATAGAGDVLTGVIAALWGQGLAPLDAAVLGVYAHGLAGDRAAEAFGQIGLIATDIIDNLRLAL
jgi:NAD(P)H-hydrate epimerase